MSKVTTKLQVSIPKALAQQYGIRPGTDLRWEAAGDALRVVSAHKAARRFSTIECLRLFDQASERRQERQSQRHIDRDGQRLDPRRAV